jgi:hypothetical protein
LGVIETTRRTIGGVVDTADVDEDEVIGSKEPSLPGLAAVESFDGHEGLEVFVVGENLDRVT